MAQRVLLRVAIAWVALVLAASPDAAHGSDTRTIFVTRIDWHTGIVIARRDLPKDAIPETADFPDAAYFEFGWGHAKYYPPLSKPLSILIDGIFPAPAVVHLIGLPRHPSEVFPKYEVIAVRVTDAGFRHLVSYLSETFNRGGAARVKPSAPGHQTFSQFYPATGTFHLFNTCNTWTARALAAGGVKVRTAGVLRVDDLMIQLRLLGQARPRPVAN